MASCFLIGKSLWHTLSGIFSSFLSLVSAILWVICAEFCRLISKPRHCRVAILLSYLCIAESSQAGISIPPPRPKRKPSYPYPKKNTGGLEGNRSCELEAEKETPSIHTQPSSTPSYMQIPPSYVSPEANSSMEPSLSQLLESAAAAAASAWSQVVANAGSKVQHQLQVNCEESPCGLSLSSVIYLDKIACSLWETARISSLRMNTAARFNIVCSFACHKMLATGFSCFSIFPFFWKVTSH